jgi:hypothetical protein
MMRVLGVHATASKLWLSCADTDGPVDIDRNFGLELPTALESGCQGSVRSRSGRRESTNAIVDDRITPCLTALSTCCSASTYD